MLISDKIIEYILLNKFEEFKDDQHLFMKIDVKILQYSQNITATYYTDDKRKRSVLYILIFVDVLSLR